MPAHQVPSAFDDFAAREPYFAVVTSPRFLRANLTPEHEREFFASGEALVDRMFAIIEAGLVPKFAPVAMLEYGCGVGRLAIPLSRRPGSVTAVDRSGVMLDVARREQSGVARATSSFRHSRNLPPHRGSSISSFAITCCSGCGAVMGSR